MGGALAETYGRLLEDIWGGQTSYLAPREFKVSTDKVSLEWMDGIVPTGDDRSPRPSVLGLRPARLARAAGVPVGRTSRGFEPCEEETIR